MFHGCSQFIFGKFVVVDHAVAFLAMMSCLLVRVYDWMIINITVSSEMYIAVHENCTFKSSY